MIEKQNFFQNAKIEAEALISPNKMEVLPGPLPDGRKSGGDEGLGSRLGMVFLHLSHKCRASRLGINSRAQLATDSALHSWGATGQNS